MTARSINTWPMASWRSGTPPSRMRGTPTTPVRIFFLLGDESVRATSAFATLESAHDSMIHAYRRKDWETAHRELESCRSQAPEIVQYVYELYEQRIADLQATPPPPDWDGVYAALMK